MRLRLNEGPFGTIADTINKVTDQVIDNRKEKNDQSINLTYDEVMKSSNEDLKNICKIYKGKYKDYGDRDRFDDLHCKLYPNKNQVELKFSSTNIPSKNKSTRSQKGTGSSKSDLPNQLVNGGRLYKYIDNFDKSRNLITMKFNVDKSFVDNTLKKHKGITNTDDREEKKRTSRDRDRDTLKSLLKDNPDIVKEFSQK